MGIKSSVMRGVVVDEKFNMVKRNRWVRIIQKFRAKVHLHNMRPVLEEEFNMPIDIVKICSRYQ